MYSNIKVQYCYIHYTKIRYVNKAFSYNIFSVVFDFTLPIFMITLVSLNASTKL